MSSFEKALVYHCSPTLCGLKPANLLSLSKDEYPHLPQLAAAYARLLEDKGIRLTILCSCGCPLAAAGLPPVDARSTAQTACGRPSAGTGRLSGGGTLLIGTAAAVFKPPSAPIGGLPA